MRKLNSLLTMIALFFCISIPAFSFPALITDNNPQQHESIQKAIELTKKLTISDKDDKDKILSEFKKILSKNPESNIIRNMYVNNLIAEKHYKEGLEHLEILNKNNLNRTNLLTQCMLKDRLGNRDESCYKEVIALSEKEKTVDSDYMIALFFAKDERFKNLKKKLIKENTFRESDFLVFTLGKEKILHEFFP